MSHIREVERMLDRLLELDRRPMQMARPPQQRLVGFDTIDVPRDRFLIASEAWRRCRCGLADADRFGIFEGNLRGLWFVACSLVKEVAALIKVETLAWDVWGRDARARADPGSACRLSC